MPRLARFLLVLAITLSTIASTATAASADPGTGSATGGAGVDPAGPSAAERKRIAEKETELRQWLASLRSSKANQPSPQVHTIYRSGFVLGWNYSEAQACYAANWCGAGSTAGIVASWKYRNGLPNPVTSNSYYEGGPTGYMKHLARDLAETRYSNNGDSGAACYDDVTWWTDSSGVSVGYLAVTNSEGPGWSYYVAVGPAGQDDFEHKVAYNLAYQGVPMVAAVKTTNLTGWNRTIDHFVNLWAFNLDTNWIQWSDSAGFLQSGSSQSLGFHDRPFSTFYSENVAPGNGFAW